MPYVPPWIGHVAFVLCLIFCGSFLGGAWWFALLLLIPAFGLVVLENRYERGLMGPRRD
jgi:membrane-bound ClpP family serine protease